MTAGHDEAEKGKGDIVFQSRGEEMGHHMIDAQPGLSRGPGQALGVGQPDQEGTDQTRSRRDGNQVDSVRQIQGGFG